MGSTLRIISCLATLIGDADVHLIGRKIFTILQLGVVYKILIVMSNIIREARNKVAGWIVNIHIIPTHKVSRLPTKDS
jgi:hypothetical protein